MNENNSLGRRISEVGKRKLFLNGILEKNTNSRALKSSMTMSKKSPSSTSDAFNPSKT